MSDSRITIGLLNPKSPDNVASVQRAAGNFDAQEIMYTGLRYPRAMALNTRCLNLARKVSQNIPVTKVDDLMSGMESSTRIVCIELVEGAIALPDYKHFDRSLYIFGPEDGNIEQSVIDRADDVVYVPTIECMNLAATVNVVLYDRIAKAANKTGDELIRSSRDTNNRLKVKTKKP